ncbi:MAG: ATPase [Phycisphaerales bacterium]|nr:ATPase [Phycisphaerales bacterium]
MSVVATKPIVSTEGAPRGLDARVIIMPCVLLLLGAYFGWSEPAFFGARNLSNLAIELSLTAVLALGMLLIILPGHIDLSVGSGAGLLGGAAAVLIFKLGWPAPAALAVVTLAALVLWLAMGTLIVTQRVPAFIVTLGGLLIFRGLHWYVINNGTIPVVRGGETNLFSLLTTYNLPPLAGLLLAGVVIAVMAIAAFASFKRLRGAGVAVDGELSFLRTFVTAQVILLFVLSCNAYQGVPIAAVILGVVATFVQVLTRDTPYGRYLYAIGGNEEAAVVSGVPVTRVVIAAFGMIGLVTALTGFLQTAYAGASTTTVGTNLELDAIAACVIGGTSLKGGRGTVGGVLMGALIVTALINGMTLLSYGPEAKNIIRGAILAAAVWADVRFGKR